MPLNLNNREEATKKEYLLETDGFGKVKDVQDLQALAQLVQRLFLLHPNTMPDDPEMGIGISDYQFEFMDAITMAELTSRANSQLFKYIPSDLINGIVIDTIQNENSKKINTIGVLVNLANRSYPVENFILTFEQAENTGKIISKIYL